MSVVRFISDHHFGHKWMAQHRGFQDEFYMNEYLVLQHNKVVNKKDLTYFLGDITMETTEWLFYLDQMNGRKRLLLGNHDMAKHVPEFLNYFETVDSILKYKGLFVSHVPIHPNELNYRVNYNIHGHVHEKPILNSSGEVDKRYINVSAEAINYKPKTLEELIPGYLTISRS